MKYQRFTNKFLTLLAVLAFVFVVGTITYNEINTSQVTIIVKLKPNEDPFIAMKSILPPGSVIQSVKAINRVQNEYQIQIATKNKSILEFLRKNTRIEKAEIKL